MKKIILSIMVALSVATGVFAQTFTVSLPVDTTVTIESTKPESTPKVYAVVNGKSKKLGTLSSTLTLPAGTSKIMVGKSGKQFSCADVGIDDTLCVNIKNPGLAGLGLGLSCVGGALLGAGLGFTMIALTEGDGDALKDFAIGTIVPGVIVTGAGLGLNLAFRTTITKK